MFTDGSCKNGRATWAISVVQQYSSHGQYKYRRVGFAAGNVDDSIGVCEQTAMDAEATAIIAMGEFALGNSHQKGQVFSAILTQKQQGLVPQGLTTLHAL